MAWLMLWGSTGWMVAAVCYAAARRERQVRRTVVAKCRAAQARTAYRDVNATEGRPARDPREEAAEAVAAAERLLHEHSR